MDIEVKPVSLEDFAAAADEIVRRCQEQERVISEAADTIRGLQKHLADTRKEVEHQGSWRLSETAAHNATKAKLAEAKLAIDAAREVIQVLNAELTELRKPQP